MNKLHKIGAILALLVLLAGMAGPVAGADFTVTVVAPQANANITSATVFSCTTNVTTNNVSYQYFNAGWQTISSNTTSGTEYNTSVAESDVADGDYTFRCLGNAGGANATASANVTKVGWDDTNPTLTEPPTTVTNPVLYGNNQCINISASDTGFTDGVSSCTLIDNLDYSSGTVMDDTGTDSFGKCWSPTAGDHRYSWNCTDAHSLSASSGEIGRASCRERV